MIRSFRGKETEELFRRSRSLRFGNIAEVARRKLRMIQDADKRGDLALLSHF